MIVGYVMDERGLNKRGQEGLTLTTLLLIILGVVAVVVVILFFTGFFGKLNTATNNIPSDLQAAVSACGLAGSSGLTADYCSTFRQVTINGATEYVTCDSIKSQLDQTKLLQSACPPVVQTSASTYCHSKNLVKGTVILGTGLTSSCPDYNSTAVASGSACTKDADCASDSCLSAKCI